MFEGGAEGAEGGEAGGGAGGGDFLGRGVQEESIWGGEGRGAGSGGVGTEVRLGEGDGEGGVCGEVEGGVAFSPVSAGGDVSGVDEGLKMVWYFMTAILTGAVVLAR